MSYDIQYNLNGTYRFSQKAHKHTKGICWLLICAIAGVAGYYLLSRANISPISVLLPGATEETALAVQNMLENIMDGTPVMEAVKTFCVQVIEYAK